jgi:hypothetical protein
VDARTLAGLALACGVHAGLLAAVRATPSAPRMTMSVQTGPSELDVDLNEPPVAPLAAPSKDQAAARDSAPTTKAKVSAAAKVAPGSPVAPDVETPGLPAGPPVEAAPTAWSFSPVARSIDLGAAVTPDMVAPRSDTSPRDGRGSGASATGGLSEGLAERDVELGMGRGGAILTALEEATRIGEAPSFGGATFDVEVRPEGITARVERADSDEAAWTRVAAAIAGTVDPKRVRLPPGARGWHVVVRIDSKIQLTDGRDVRTLHGLRAVVTAGQLADALEGKPAAGASSTAPGGPDHVDPRPSDPPPVGGELGKRGPGNPLDAMQALLARVVPVPALTVNGKVCSATFAVTPMGISIGGLCSPENIGMPEHRIVWGKIVREGSL